MTRTPTPSLPGSGPLQSQSDYVIGNTYWQDVWRGDQGWLRHMPMVGGAPDFNQASAWAGPYFLSAQPGTGTLQAESNVILGTTMWQSVWRGDQEFLRSVPIVGETPQFGSASAWTLKTSVRAPLGDKRGISSALTLGGTPTKYYYFGSQRVAMRTASGVTYLHSVIPRSPRDKPRLDQRDVE